jgi:O-antigen/teichoic acid export membrane protein
MNSKFTSLREMLQGKGLKAEMLRGGLASMVFKVAGLFLSLALSVILVHLIGAAGYGVYAYAMALVAMLVIPAEFGMPTLLVRETAKAQALSNWPIMKGLWHWANRMTLVLSVAMTLLGIGIALIHYWLGDSEKGSVLLWTVWLIPLLSMGSLRGAMLRGLGRVIQSQLPTTIVRPILMLLLLGLLVSINGFERVSVFTAIQSDLLALALSFLLGSMLLRDNRPPQTVNTEAEFEKPMWTRSVIPLGVLGGMQLINANTGMVMLGWFESNEMVGVYRVVTHAAALILFGLQATNMVVAAQFARLHAREDHRRLQELVTQCARFVTLAAAVVALPLLSFGKPILIWVFGDVFGQGALALAIIAIGQLINAMAGSVGFLLTMTGHEKIVTRGFAISAVVNIASNAILVPQYGIEGAAVATCISLIVWNGILLRSVRNLLGINSTIFG